MTKSFTRYIIAPIHFGTTWTPGWHSLGSASAQVCPTSIYATLRSQDASHRNYQLLKRGTFSLVQTFFRLGEVDEDLKICLKLLEIMARDLNYARHQLQGDKSSQSLQISSVDLRHFESAIDDTDAATLSLGELVQVYCV
jgi:hypothetical protein